MNHKFPESPSTPTPSARKRNYGDMDDEQKLLGSQKRLKFIEEAINQQKIPSASSQTNTVNYPTTSPATPSRPSRKFNPSSSQNSAPAPSGSIWPSTPQGSQGLTAPRRDTSVHDNTETPVPLADEELSADSIAAAIQRLGTQIPNYIRKLERKKIAAEKSRESRDNKITFQQTHIENLEREVERLKAREKELEEVIAAYEQE